MGAQPAQKTVVMPAPPGAAVTFQSTVPETDYETAQRRIAESKAQFGEALGRLQTVSGTPIDVRDRLAERELASAGAYLSSLPRGDKYISAERYQPAVEAATRRYANLKTLTPEPAESAISSLYQNILNRLPDLKGFQYWTQDDPRSRGGINREEKAELQDIFKKGQETIRGGQGTDIVRPQTPRQTQVAQLYKDVLGREPDEPGLKYWSESGLDIPGVKRQLETSAEKRQQQIKGLYQNILGRTADEEGLKYWSEQDPRAQEGFTSQELEDISSDFRRSAEYQSKGRNEQIENLYKSVLGRGSDPEGLKYWSESGQDIGTIEANLRRSDEYQKKMASAPAPSPAPASSQTSTPAYSLPAPAPSPAPAPAQSRSEQIENLYRSVLGRQSDPEGLKYWSESGQDIGTIEANIRRSEEYQNRARG